MYYEQWDFDVLLGTNMKLYNLSWIVHTILITYTKMLYYMIWVLIQWKCIIQISNCLKYFISLIETQIFTWTTAFIFPEPNIWFNFSTLFTNNSVCKIPTSIHTCTCPLSENYNGKFSSQSQHMITTIIMYFFVQTMFCGINHD